MKAYMLCKFNMIIQVCFHAAKFGAFFSKSGEKTPIWRRPLKTPKKPSLACFRIIFLVFTA